MHFEWDERKNATNQRKHRISFEKAIKVFEDPFHLPRVDERFSGVLRWRTIGYAGDLFILVAHDYRETNDGQEIIRIISARKASARERKVYEKGS